MKRVLQLNGAGCAIRKLRADAGLSLRELAKRLGWDRGRLSKYETDERALSLPVIEELAEGLDKPPLVVVLRCLEYVYPDLSTPDSKAATLVRRLVAELSKP